MQFQPMADEEICDPTTEYMGTEPRGECGIGLSLHLSQ